ncbi:MAG TPA: restriction endonuclease subunit S [Kiritimatiellia bacterium]|nr:restriction endonuclease subunit S [Kiritimatiellia bacterium]HMP35038.1 restriction endonuclease subunit S [Kiritimatiellia bacterium]
MIKNVKKMKKNARLGDLAEIKGGYAPRRGVEDEKAGEVAFLQVGDFSEDRRRIEKAPTHINPEGSNPRMLQAGDVLFLAKGRKPFGYALNKVEKPMIAAGYFFIVRPSDRVVPEYLAWFLSLENTRRHLLKEAGGGTHMPVVRRDVLESIEIPLPSLEVQRAVVELAELMEEEADLLEKMKRLRAQLVGGMLRQLIEEGDAQ